LDVGPQPLERGRVRLATGANRYVDRLAFVEAREQFHPSELAQLALEAVSIHGALLMTRNHDAYARKTERGSADAHVEMHGPNSLPLSNDDL
jgi:hypothetical protein